MRRVYGKGKPRRRSGEMNKLEQKYADYLETLLRAGEILWYAYEPWKFRLADRTFYTPDFIVVASNHNVEAHEVKGFWEDDARVKIKVAAEMHPISFFAIKWVKGEWQVENFK